MHLEDKGDMNWLWSFEENTEGKDSKYRSGRFRKEALLDTAWDEKNGCIILGAFSSFTSLYHNFLIHSPSWNPAWTPWSFPYVINYLEKRKNNFMNSLGIYKLLYWARHGGRSWSGDHAFKIWGDCWKASYTKDC